MGRRHAVCEWMARPGPEDTHTDTTSQTVGLIKDIQKFLECERSVNRILPGPRQERQC